MCYWCNKDLGVTEGNGEDRIHYVVCDECARRLKLDERLPTLVWDIIALRERNGGTASRPAPGFTSSRQFPLPSSVADME